MKYTILDCYTDEPSGLGVPPYLGTYPRYLAGKFGKVDYITIDDLRLHEIYKSKRKNEAKTNIKIYNTTNQDIGRILKETKVLLVNLGVHTPGKYLSAVPGTLKEVIPLINDLKCKKVLVGPANFGTQLTGGRSSENFNLDGVFDDFIWKIFEDYDELKEYAINGAYIFKKIPRESIVEIETARGCQFGACSFCTEPLKYGRKEQYRDQDDIHLEVKALMKNGAKHIRLGKQSCIFSYKNGEVKEIEKLMRPLAEMKLKTLHVDNVNPNLVNEERAKIFVETCTPGNVAAFGVESFDMKVVIANKLNTKPEIAMRAIRILNKVGAKRGENGLPYLLPGLNLILGLKNEDEESLKINYDSLKEIIDEGLLLRRINIRQVVTLPGTEMEKTGYKYLKKNKTAYFNFRKKVRNDIDRENLKRLVPAGTVLKDVRMEIYDGKTTFGRQMGTYPLVVGINNRLELEKYYNVRVTDYGLRSITGEIVK
ncbi:MAG TPA: radical SAM protein [Candidatus Nanoarchaeia archaeon]|nr:radical SAM protein [Candidatus Nanoarchaeia archaeon]